MKTQDFLQNLNWRYATKAFDPSRKLSDEQVHALDESLRLAASSFGLQPWKFVVVENQALKEKLLPHSWNQKQVVECSHLYVLCTLKEMSTSHVDNFVKSMASERGVSVESLKGYHDMMLGFIKSKSPEWAEQWMKNQVYIALGTLLTSCAFLGIDSCAMEGIVQSKYDEILGLSQHNARTVVACPVGYRASTDKHAGLKKVRFPAQDILIKM